MEIFFNYPLMLWIILHKTILTIMPTYYEKSKPLNIYTALISLRVEVGYKSGILMDNKIKER